jgi:NDP-sugar pyrophosphorylase family protein
MNKPTLAIMAAGIGSRYGGLKQLDPVGPSGEFIIDYSIYDAIKAGFQKVAFIISPEIEAEFKQKIGNRIAEHCEVSYVVQTEDKYTQGIPYNKRTKPWGTGHAILCCKEQIDEPFAVINADDFYGQTAFEELFDYLKTAEDKITEEGNHKGKTIADYCMVGYILKNTLTENGHVSRGICHISDDGFLTDVKEYVKLAKFGDEVKFQENDQDWQEIKDNKIVSMNLWGFTPSIFRELEQKFAEFVASYGQDINQKEFFIPTVVNDMIQESRATVKVLTCTEKWFGITYKEDKSVVVNAISEMNEEGIYPENLWKQK